MSVGISPLESDLRVSKLQFSGLWRHPDFMKLWVGQTISGFGSHITRDGLPLVAILVLAATPAQMGLLAAVASLPVLVLGLFAGVWVDRLPRRPVMILMDITRLLILLSIPLAALTDRLTMTHLYVVAALVSIGTLFFDIAYRAILPTLISREHLLEGNSKLATTDSLAEIGGPAITGLLVQWIGAPLAIFFDSATFLVSAVSIGLIRKAEPPPPPRSQRRMIQRDIAEGLRAINDNPTLRTLTIGIGLRSFFGNFFATLYSLYVIRELGLSAAALGVIIGAGGIGALIGAMLAGWLPRRFGLGQVLTGALLCSSLVNLVIPLASGPALAAGSMLFAAQVIGDAAMMVYEVNEMSFRQMAIPDHLLGRVNASVGVLTGGIAPLGAIIAGLLATSIGMRPAICIATLGILMVALWTVRHLDITDRIST